MRKVATARNYFSPVAKEVSTLFILCEEESVVVSGLWWLHWSVEQAPGGYKSWGAAWPGLTAGSREQTSANNKLQLQFQPRNSVTLTSRSAVSTGWHHIWFIPLSRGTLSPPSPGLAAQLPPPLPTLFYRDPGFSPASGVSDWVQADTGARAPPPHTDPRPTQHSQGPVPVL